MKENSVKTPWYNNKTKIRNNLIFPTYGIYKQFKMSVLKNPKNIALNYFGKKITYQELLNKIDNCAKALKEKGIRKKDRVTICMPNTPEAVIFFYAINKIGAISNIIHPLSAENEIKYALNLSKSKMIICLDLVWEKVSKVIKKTKVKNSVIVSVSDSMPFMIEIGYKITNSKKIKKILYNDEIISYKDFINQGIKYNFDTFVDVKDNDSAVILYSGGTTGTSKGIVLSNLNFNALAIQCIEICPVLFPGMRVLSILPIFHGFGLGVCIHTVLSFGMTGIILPQFSVNTFDKLLSKYKPNLILGVPTLYEALLKNKNIKKMDLSFIKCAVSGGDCLTISMKEKVDKFFKEHNSLAQIRQGYGLTESVAACCFTQDDEKKDNSIGYPLPNNYIKIVKPGTSKELPYGEEGEIVISGPTVMKRYLSNIEETFKTLKRHKDGLIWLHTGDLGSMDDEGSVFFHQRLKRMIISSGYNIYPSRIENVIEELPFVLNSCVIGVPHPYKIQVAKAFVVLKSKFDANETIRNEIYDHCVKNLAKYSLPYEIEFKKELPVTKIGKIDYRRLEEEELKKIKNK